MLSRIVLIFCLLVFLCPSSLKGQKIGFTGGVAVGPESFIALPELGLYYKYYDKDWELRAGAEGSIWFLFAGWATISMYHSVEYKMLSLETSFSYFNYVNQFAGPFDHVTFTPKVGLNWKEIVQFQIGPSLFLYSDHGDPVEFFITPFTKVGNFHLNYELSFSVEFF